MPEEFSPEMLEESLNTMEVLDEFNTTVDYDKFIVLSKKDLADVLRLVEPLTKQAIDDYGKSIFVHCASTDVVEISYTNSPYTVVSRIQNKSGKMVSDFAVSVVTFKKVVTSTVTSLILVEDNDCINIALCESLLYLDTKPLRAESYNIHPKECSNLIDKELALYTFRKIGSSLSLTERASEKVVVVKDGYVHFNTGVFTSKSKSPFSTSDNFVLYKQVSDIIAILSDLSKAGVSYSLYDSQMTLNCDDRFYVEVEVGLADKVQQFISPSAELLLNFKATIGLINDNILRLVSIVKNLDYLSDIVTLRFTSDAMELEIGSKNQSKKSVYTFSYVEGRPDEQGEMKLTADVLQMFLNIAGSDCTYNFNSSGLGIETSLGKFLIRKS